MHALVGMATSSAVPQPGDVVRVRAARWRVSRATRYETSAIIEVRGIDRDNAGDHARFILPFEPIEHLRPPAGARVLRPARWRRHVRGILAEALPGIDSLRSAAGARITLLPFQLEPALAVVRGHAARLLIADAVGLGKTIQAGLVIAETLARTPDALVLVVAPAGLRAQWQAELAERFAIDAALVDAAALAATGSIDINPWTRHSVSIASVDFVKRAEVLRSFEPLLWDLVVFDEAHALAGRSDRAAAARVLAERARTSVMLSATPHSGDDEAFARLASLGNLRDRFPLLLFQRTRADLGIAATRRSRWLRVRPTPAEAAMHAALLAYAAQVWREAGPDGRAARLALGVLLRRACSSAWSLARSLERRRTALAERPAATARQLPLPLFDQGADDEEPDAILGAPGLQDANAEQSAIAAVLQTAQAATGRESKLAALDRLVRRAREPLIAFTEYRDTLSRVADALARYRPVLLHGGLPAAERAAALRAFVDGGSSLLLATDAASEGLNLHQRCRLVVNVELPWTPVRLEQRIGRVDRIGQARPVHAVHLVAANTREEATVARLHERTARVDATLNGFRPGGVDENDVADAIVLGVEAPAPAPPAPRYPDAVVVTDLRNEATREADHAGLIRALLTDRGGGESIPPRRPVLTRIRPRAGRRPAPGRYWGVHVAFSTPDDEVAWATVLCLHGEPQPGTEFLDRWRTSLDSRWLEDLVLVTQRGMLERARAAAHRWRNLAEVRELAIAAALGDRRARMAATLIQHGLFDRRAERMAAAQAALLATAARQSEERLERLRRHVLVAAPTRLAFAALVR